jgi:hypothetical protein
LKEKFHAIHMNAKADHQFGHNKPAACDKSGKQCDKKQMQSNGGAAGDKVKDAKKEEIK